MMFASKTAAKREAQDVLLSGVAYALGYWQETHADVARQMTEAERADFRAVLREQADRLAKVFGYDEAWSE